MCRMLDHILCLNFRARDTKGFRSSTCLELLFMGYNITKDDHFLPLGGNCPHRLLHQLMKPSRMALAIAWIRLTASSLSVAEPR